MRMKSRRKYKRNAMGGYVEVRPKDNIFRVLGFDRDEADLYRALSSLRIKAKDEALAAARTNA